MNPDQQYVRSAEVRIKPVGRSVAAFVSERKALHVLNPTARLILEYLETPASRAELALMLTEATDASEKQVREDLDDTLSEFLEQRLIEPAS